MFSNTVRAAASCVTKDIPFSPKFSPTIFYRDADSVLHTSSRSYSCNDRLYAQNPVFEIVHQESVKVYLHIHVQRECSAEASIRSAASRVTKDLPISPLFSPTIFYRDANSILFNTPLYRSRLYAQNPVFEIAHQESVKV